MKGLIFYETVENDPDNQKRNIANILESFNDIFFQSNADFLIHLLLNTDWNEVISINLVYNLAFIAYFEMSPTLKSTIR